jgi:hypothetical protein
MRGSTPQESQSAQGRIRAEYVGSLYIPVALKDPSLIIFPGKPPKTAFGTPVASMLASTWFHKPPKGR